MCTVDLKMRDILRISLLLSGFFKVGFSTSQKIYFTIIKNLKYKQKKKQDKKLQPLTLYCNKEGKAKNK